MLHHVTYTFQGLQNYQVRFFKMSFHYKEALLSSRFRQYHKLETSQITEISSWMFRVRKTLILWVASRHACNLVCKFTCDRLMERSFKKVKLLSFITLLTLLYNLGLVLLNITSKNDCVSYVCKQINDLFSMICFHLY